MAYWQICKALIPASSRVDEKMYIPFKNIATTKAPGKTKTKPDLQRHSPMASISSIKMMHGW